MPGLSRLKAQIGMCMMHIPSSSPGLSPTKKFSVWARRLSGAEIGTAAVQLRIDRGQLPTPFQPLKYNSPTPKAAAFALPRVSLYVRLAVLLGGLYPKYLHSFQKPVGFGERSSRRANRI